ncbi:MAG: methylated-DNA/protein-cysteine methyltransferase [Chthonomonadaceae bacterium]|nr:methylated-DNA/protein-cysteine methyltransferase [Chthonomonadaceae bacterium]
MTLYTYYDSPVQPLLLTSDGAALTGLYMVEHRHGPEVGADWIEQPDALPFAETKRQLAAYFAGQLTEFDLPLAPGGTEFQQKVWQELRRIPYGTTLSYGELARRIGNPNASRAVGLANGRNPISIIVPCHRVIGASGKLVGYGGGLSRKETLLTLEGSGAERSAQTSLFATSEPAG